MAIELCECSVADVIEINRTPRKAPVDILYHLPHKEILRQSAEAVDFLHRELKSVHRNLHPDNFLVFRIADNHYVIKLTDFQLTKNWKTNPDNSGSSGSDGWTAPESKGDKETSETDVFILGCYFFYVLSSGKHPFGGQIERMGRIGNSDDRVYNKKEWDKEGDIWNSINDSLKRQGVDEVIQNTSRGISMVPAFFSI